MLRKDDTSRQLVYYQVSCLLFLSFERWFKRLVDVQAGITRSTSVRIPVISKAEEMFDALFATNLSNRVKCTFLAVYVADPQS